MSKCSMQKKIESLSRKNEKLSNTKDYRIKGVAEDKQSEAEETPDSDGFVYIKPDPKYNKAKWGNRGCDFGSFTSQLHKKGDTYTGLVYVQDALREFSTDGKTGYFRDSKHKIPTNNVDYAALWKECQRIFRMNKSWKGLQTEGKEPAPEKEPAKNEMSKCSMQKKIESLSKKNEALENESEEVQAMIKELAEETGNDYSDAEIGDYAPGKGICVKFGDEEYYCYEDYSDAEEASNEGVKQILDDLGIDGINFDNIGGIEQFVDTDWFDVAKRESAEFYVSDIKESEPERYKEEFGDLDEEDAVEQFLSMEEEDSIKWYLQNFGKDDFNEVVKDKGLVDLDALAEAITEADGPANELARYDGKEIELPCGYYCYRSY